MFNQLRTLHLCDCIGAWVTYYSTDLIYMLNWCVSLETLILDNALPTVSFADADHHPHAPRLLTLPKLRHLTLSNEEDGKAQEFLALMNVPSHVDVNLRVKKAAGIPAVTAFWYEMLPHDGSRLPILSSVTDVELAVINGRETNSLRLTGHAANTGKITMTVDVVPDEPGRPTFTSSTLRTMLSSLNLLFPDAPLSTLVCRGSLEWPTCQAVQRELLAQYPRLKKLVLADPVRGTRCADISLLLGALASSFYVDGSTGSASLHCPDLTEIRVHGAASELATRGRSEPWQRVNIELRACEDAPVRRLCLELPSREGGVVEDVVRYGEVLRLVHPEALLEIVRDSGGDPETAMSS
ncbi:hypothetical protein C8Q76DRAFT_746830 [Earliella scabrosa]|nr:hypothetical protein C8Q76DRAFT_746830 [Earliella scabrosa]